MRPVILLIGAKGQVAWELRRTLATLGKVVTGGMDGADYRLDLSVRDDVHRVVAELKPALIVNAAAYTAVDKAESEPEIARQVNELALGYIAELAAENACPVVHYSTDYVFSGEGETPWRETDIPAPRSVYGETKLGGELALASSDADHVILRTAWVYGARGSNFLLTMQRLFREKKQLGIVSDQFGAPTWSRDIAEATALLLAQSRRQDEPGFAFGEHKGTYHMTAAGSTSWYGFATAIHQILGADCELNPITTEQYPTPASRPAYSVLDNARLADIFGIQLPQWQESLALCLETSD